MIIRRSYCILLAAACCALPLACSKQPEPAPAAGAAAGNAAPKLPAPELSPEAAKRKAAAQSQQKGKNAAVKPARPAKAQPKKPAAPALPKMEIVEEWDFTKLGEQEWEWEMRRGARPSPRGAFFSVVRPGVGPALNPEGLDAADIKEIRVEMVISRRKDKESKPEMVKIANPLLFWAAPEDVEEGGWPFKKEKRAGFRKATPNGNLWRLDLTRIEQWKGPISRLAFTIPVPETVEEGQPPYSVLVKKVQFLK